MTKKFIKKMIGPDKRKKIRAYINYLLSIKSKKNNKQCLCNDIEDIYQVKNPNGHIFCGYFDISPDNPYNKDEILVGMLKKMAEAGKDDLMIALADYKKGKLNPITTTKAWSWQMGSRLRWSKKKNIIYYNDFINDNYCCVIFDIETKKVIDRIPSALYDISSNEEFGLSINFSRLQRLRPGYGYSNKEDITKLEDVPKNDGLFFVDLKTKKERLIVSYEQLVKFIPESSNHQCYINHVSISPNNKRAMFFFIWRTTERPGWRATLWTIDLSSEKLTCLEKIDQVSHYDWQDDDNLIITGIKKADNVGFYRIYNCLNNTYQVIDNSNLKQDGHPVFSRCFNGFYSDTYPNKKNYQTFFAYKNNQYIPLLRLFHDPRMFGEKRCDLHPHYFQNDELIALDTTYRKNKRQILIVRMNNEFKK